MPYMNLGVDARMLWSSGIGRYLRQVLRWLPRLDHDLHLTLVGDRSLTARAVNELHLPGDRTKIRHWSAPVYSLREQVEGPTLFSGLRVTGVFFPHYNVPILLRQPYVVTIHDLTHLRFPRSFGRIRAHIARSVLGRAMKNARRVVTGSEASREDIELWFPEVRDKVVVIWHGLDDCFREPPSPSKTTETLRARCLAQPYILTVGNRKPHKNLGVAADTIRRLRTYQPNIAWVVVGRRFSEYDEVDRARADLGESLVELHEVSDEELQSLYAGAAALFMPTLSEGFGLPVIEAMACGTPVIASRVPAIAEVAGGAALLYAPGDVIGFAEGLLRVTTDETLRWELVAKGYEVVRRYDWNLSVRQLAALLREAFEGQ